MFENILIVILHPSHNLIWSWGAKPVATPARSLTTTTAPAHVPRKKGPVGGSGGGMVKVEALPPPCSSFTPVKSPDQKKPKPSSVEPMSGGCGRSIKRSLCGELGAAVDGMGSTPVSTEMDSSLGTTPTVTWFNFTDPLAIYIKLYKHLNHCRTMETSHIAYGALIWTGLLPTLV